jgi:hypothetical protein
MTSRGTSVRRMAAITGAVALVAMGGLSACSKEEKPAPTPATAIPGEG